MNIYHGTNLPIDKDGNIITDNSREHSTNAMPAEKIGYTKVRQYLYEAVDGHNYSTSEYLIPNEPAKKNDNMKHPITPHAFFFIVSRIICLLFPCILPDPISAEKTWARICSF